MAKSKQTNNLVLALIAVIGFSLILIGLFATGGIDPIAFEGLIGFSLLDINSPRLVCTDTTCVWNWRSLDPVTIGSSGGFKEEVDLSLVNTNQPIIVDVKVDLVKISDDCERLIDTLVVHVEINNDGDTDFPLVAGKAETIDIQPVVKATGHTEGELEVRIGSQACFPIDAQKLGWTATDGQGSAPSITFTRAGGERSADEIMNDLMGIESPVVVECLGCGGGVIAVAENELMCPVLDCAGGTTPAPRPTIPDPDPLGFSPPDPIPEPPMLTIGGTSTIVFVVVGVIMIAVVGTAIFLRRRNAIDF